MAKKKSENVELGGASDILKLINKFDDTTEILENSTTSNTLEFISTGNYILNACLSGSMFKGIPSGRIISYCGENATGKSFLAVSSCREAQKQGWTPIYLDSENSMSPEFVGRLGCDPKNFIIKQVSTVKEVTTFIINLCKSFEEQGVTFPKVFLVLDSLGNLTSDKELGDSIEGKTARDMTRAQEVKALFRVVTTPLARLQIPLICINHVYASMSFMGGFSQASGCLFPEEEIITKSGIKAIKDVIIGDEVLSHDGNYHLVEKTWNHQKNSYQIDFEGNKKIQCSDTHRFLINPSEPEKDESWILASELKDGDEIYIIEE